MQSSILAGRQAQFYRHQHPALRRASRASRQSVRTCFSSNGNGASASTVSACPSPAETARTVVHLASEGTLSTITHAGSPLGAPVAYTLDKDGQPIMQVLRGSPEESNLRHDPRCSLHVQPITYPARGVASVSLQGSAVPADGAAADGAEDFASYKLQVASCVYYGGLDESAVGCTVSGDEFRGAEPDPLRHAAEDLISTWNSDRAEDIYRIVGQHLKVPLVDMAYTELLWLDRLGMYIRSEVAGQPPQVVRVPFYRPVLDERDARSVVTMAAQIAWESERSYTPSLPPLLSDAAAN